MRASDPVKTVFGAVALVLLAVMSGPALAQSLMLSDGTFSALGANGDGDVSPEEFSFFSGYAFGVMDSDRNGALSLDEITPHFERDQLDTDTDGSVSPQEFSGLMSSDFEAADTDGNGVLN